MTTETTTTATPTAKPLNACWCGCGGTTRNRFVPGHDARFHGWAKKVARGQLAAQETLDRLPHDEARDELLRHADLELPKHEEREARKAEAALEKKRLKDAAKTTPTAPAATETPAPTETVVA